MDLVARAKGLIIRPRDEWQIIAGEPADTAGLFKSYVMPMAAIPVMAGFIGAAILARMFAGILPELTMGALLLQSIVIYIVNVAGVWVFGKVVQTLAPRFGGTSEEISAMKLAAYSPTAMWLAGVFALLPPLAIMVFLGLYSLYILYKGVPIVTRVPEAKAMVFTLALVACGIVLKMLTVLLISPLLPG